ncbi:hypothetical protein ACIBHX_36530 [Nonomuraea sp. NPDC050536]|uniref:hypothetical protein n=1 Tax=Nonomuraea sp. NPDC050536 TaxID=3364366 RepID=UPI0037C62403
MTFAFTYDVPIGRDVYQRLVRDLGPEFPPGMILHLAHEIPGGLRYFDVWESKEAHADFVENRLHPVVDRIVTETLGFRPPEPPHTELTVVDVWAPGAAH